MSNTVAGRRQFDNSQECIAKKRLWRRHANENTLEQNATIATWLECFQEQPSWCRNEQVCQGRISVKRFERSNGLDTVLYK